MFPAHRIVELGLALSLVLFILATGAIGHDLLNPPPDPKVTNQIVIGRPEESGKVLSCFTGDTKILMAGGDEKNIENINVGDKILTRESKLSSKPVVAVVLDVEKHIVDQYVVINGNIKVTIEHTMFINGDWKPVALIGHGDKLLAKDGKEVEVKSLSIRRGNFEVYNLKIEEYHTYVASGFYVHD